MTVTQRHILHVDMDAFYASVEQRDNPALRGKPLVVGGSSNRGVVAAASYEARTFGIRSAMPMREARRRCPELLQAPVRMTCYKSESDKVFAVFREFTPLVEGLSLDEAFLDVTGSTTLFGAAAEIAATIKQRIFAKTNLTASVGVAPNKLVAKIASDLDKPDGLVVVEPASMRATLDPLPVQVIPGIGKETLKGLHGLGIATIADLRLATARDLETLFGRFASRMRDRAAGIDDRPVVSDRASKSISAEETFNQDLRDSRHIQKELLSLTERMASRLRAKGLHAGTLQLKIRQSDFTTFSRQRSLQPPSDNTQILHGAARELLQIWRQEHVGTAIRLLGVGASDLVAVTQGDLFAAAPDEPVSSLDETVDKIRKRFGSLPLGRARTFDEDQIG
ncbi:MAG: DNA polymerase IV [Woeseia sp.]|nr:DNA polymerase IV [Woeseia sp.]MBT8095807.1 DNA polymerase IV [Woeseia sp.]NNE61743.1 DNA polymerase IV [Woeseia sp.]NNL54156.1 DNA polymerase IV [Woeseia sp.]